MPSQGARHDTQAFFDNRDQGAWKRNEKALGTDIRPATREPAGAHEGREFAVVVFVQMQALGLLRKMHGNVVRPGQPVGNDIHEDPARPQRAEYLPDHDFAIVGMQMLNT